jgi:hypothetical protein
MTPNAGTAGLTELEAEMLSAMEVVSSAYKRDNPVRTADVHDETCTCMRCAVDAVDYVISKVGHSSEGA